MIMTQTANTTTRTFTPDLGRVLDTIARRSYAVLATTSAERPHAAGVIYSDVDGKLYASTGMDSRKARNIAANSRVFVTIPVHRMPFAPPSAIQFAGTGEVLPLDDPEILRLAAENKIKKITGHGEFELPGGCFLKITPGRRILTYGIGMSLWHLYRHPLDAAGVVELP